MAAANLLALLDDIATVLDDVALMTKVAAKKTAGVLGDDLALNAEQVSGVSAERELPVVWAVFKGSMLNKLILVPAALLISAFIPWLITPLLILGGLYLCFEGFEKVWHKLFDHKEVAEEKEALKKALHESEASLIKFENAKIKGAIRTDFILSAEIIVIALGTVAEAAISKQIMTISLIAILMTIGVYGFVALIVKLDDMGLFLQKQHAHTSLRYKFGYGLVAFCPYLMKFLTIAGTAAMFLVGGGILVHGIPFLHHLSETIIHTLAIEFVVSTLFNAVMGIIAGGILVMAVKVFNKVRGN